MGYDVYGEYQPDNQWQTDAPVDWFTQNQPPPTPSLTPDYQRSTATITSPNVRGQVNPAELAQAAGRGGVTGPQAGSFSGNLQDLWNQYRSAHPDFHPTQGAATSLQPFVDWAKGQGANLSIASPSSGGYVKGITDANGQFIKLLNGSDQPIWLPGGDAPNSGGGPFGYGDVPQYQPYSQQFSYQPWDKTFTPPTGANDQNDPGYSFRQEQGNNSILQNAAKMGIARTGGTLKDLDIFNQNYASGEYEKVYGRALDAYNQELGAYNLNRNNAYQNFLTNYGIYGDNYSRSLAGQAQGFGQALSSFGANQGAQNQAFGQQFSLANLGLSAAGGQAGLYSNYGNNVANIYGQGGANMGAYTTQIGNAQAAGQVGSANAWNNGIGGISSDLSALYANQGRSMYGNNGQPQRSPYGGYIY